MKTDADYFSDWEGDAFGFGYGSGEPHVLGALKTFMGAIGRPDHAHAYDYRQLEAALTPTVAWLLINALCKVDAIEYGSSPRYGWLTPHGERLKAFIDANTLETLTDLSGRYMGDGNPPPCYPSRCNCDGEKCSNPFWAPQGRKD